MDESIAILICPELSVTVFFSHSSYNLITLYLRRLITILLGDHMYKQNTKLPVTEQVIIALPDVQARLLNAEYGDFIVLGCDGIWNSLSSQSTVDFLSSLVNQSGIRLSSVCEEVIRTR